MCQTDNQHNSFLNICPGVCVDSSSVHGQRTDENGLNMSGITSAEFNEFYLNSHVAIQGTAKAAKYTLIYDEIGMKISELELLTYWISYMYSRCNRSVSIATPSYYAHWAAKRARHLLNAGASENELVVISKVWAENEFTSMYFI